MVEACDVLHHSSSVNPHVQSLLFPPGRRPVQKISPPMVAPHDTVRGRPRDSAPEVTSKYCCPLFCLKKLINEERNTILLLIQHNDVLTFNSQTVALPCYLATPLGPLFYWVQKDIESHGRNRNKGSALLKVTWKQQPTHLSFPALFFPRASMCMVLTKGHLSQKHTNTSFTSYAVFFSVFFFYKQNSLAGAIKRDTFGTEKT